MRFLKAFAVVMGVLSGAAAVAKFVLKTDADPIADTFDLVSIYDGHSFRPTTQSLLSGRAISIFGGNSIDLRRAHLDGSGATLRVLSLFGGNDITVPDTWKVTTRTIDVLGGSSIRVTPESMLADDAPHLEVSSVSVFGGLAMVARPVLVSAEAG